MTGCRFSLIALGLPVPCTAIIVTMLGSISHDAKVFCMRLVCDGPFGAVKPLERPSWFIAEPFTIAIDDCIFRSWGTITKTANPSPRPYPSAVLSNDLQRPTAESACGN